MVSELYNVIPPNGLYQIISQRKKEEFSNYEYKMIERIMNQIQYAMDSITYNSSGRFIGNFLSNVRVIKRESSFFIYYKENFISFTKYEDDYILVIFGKDNIHDFSNHLRYSNKMHDIRFGVMCDDIEGLICFYQSQMVIDDFIRKIMLGEKL